MVIEHGEQPRVMCHHRDNQVERRTWGLSRESWPRASTVVVSKHGIANRMECQGSDLSWLCVSRA